MGDDHPPFEIIHDEPPARKRKPKRLLPYIYLPWRWMGAAFGAGAILVVAVFALLNVSPAAAPTTATPAVNPNITATPPIPPVIESTPVNVGEYIEDIARSGDYMVVAGTNTLRLYKNDVLVKVLATYSNDMHNRRFVASFAPDGRQFAFLSTAQAANTFFPIASVTIWDTDGNSLTTFEAHSGSGFQNYMFAAVTYSPDGRWLATGAGDGKIKLWDTTDYQPRAELETLGSGTVELAFSGDSQHLSAVNLFGDWGFGSDLGANAQRWNIADLSQPQVETAVTIPAYNAHWSDLSTDGHYVAYMTDEQNALGLHDLEADTDLGQLTLDDQTNIEDIALNHAGDQLAIVQRTLIQPADEPSEVPVVQVIVRAVHLDYSSNGFQYQELGRPREMGSVSAYRVAFRDEHSLEYVTFGTNNFLHWDFTTGVVQSMSF